MQLKEKRQKGSWPDCYCFMGLKCNYMFNRRINTLYNQPLWDQCCEVAQFNPPQNSNNVLHISRKNNSKTHTEAQKTPNSRKQSQE